MKKILYPLALGVSLIGLNAMAGLQGQIDTSTNLLPVLTTNTYALYGDITGLYTNGFTIFSGSLSSGNVYTTNGVFVSTTPPSPNAFIDMSKTTCASLEVGGYFANTASGASNIVFQIYNTTDDHLWQLFSNVVVSVPALSTNWAWTTFTLSEGGINNAPYTAYALRAVQNTNGASVSVFTNAVTGAQSSLFFKAFTRTGI